MTTVEDLDGFQIDSELRALIPTPTTDELRGLVDDIKRDGCILNPVVVWPVEDGYVLVDGHNRIDAWHSLTNDGHDIPAPSYCVKEFADRDECKWWMIAHQLHRRNVTKEQRDQMLRQMYELAKQESPDTTFKKGNKAAEKRRVQNEPAVSGKPKGRAAERVAEAANVSKATVVRAVSSGKPKPKPAPKPEKSEHAERLVSARKAIGVLQGHLMHVGREVPESRIDLDAVDTHAKALFHIVDAAARRVK